jgi:hypothetical protein
VLGNVPSAFRRILQRIRGVRYFFRNFTALAVKEHLRSQIEGPRSGAKLTPNEVELVRFAADRSGQLAELADTSPER